MITTIYSDPDFLEHHGVKGMKWGVRRYQNYDGTLTAAGRKHVGVKSSGASSSFTKKEKLQEVDYTELAGYEMKGTIKETRYSHESDSGRKKFDSEADAESQATRKRVQEKYGTDPGDKNLIGGDLQTKFESLGITFVSKIEKDGVEKAEQWLDKSELKDYDYEIVVNEESYTINEGEKYVTASITVQGNKWEFGSGVEADYSDDGYVINKEAASRRQQKIAEVENSKEYKRMQSRIDEIYEKTENMKTSDPGYYDLLDEWDELEYKKNQYMKKKLGDDY